MDERMYIRKHNVFDGDSFKERYGIVYWIDNRWVTGFHFEYEVFRDDQFEDLQNLTPENLWRMPWEKFKPLSLFQEEIPDPTEFDHYVGETCHGRK